MDKVRELIEAVHCIHKSLNLFEGYVPKKTEGKTQEALFWRDVVNMYGLFCDCDRVQIKEEENLFKMFKKYSLISQKQYKSVSEFYFLISALRTWFCHNYNKERYYTQKTEATLQRFLKRITTTCEVGLNPEEMDWTAADIYIRECFDKYLDLLADVLKKIEVSAYREQIKDEWCGLYAKALYNDRELLNNILAENYKYYCMDLGIPMHRIKDKTQQMRQSLEKNEYSYRHIYKNIIDHSDQVITASELVRESIEPLLKDFYL